MGHRLTWLLREFGAGLTAMGQCFGALTPPECYGFTSSARTQEGREQEALAQAVRAQEARAREAREREARARGRGRGPGAAVVLSAEERAQWRCLVRQLKTAAPAADRRRRPR